MKIIALGDTHRRNDWQRIVSKENDADKIIFIGDYFDSKEDISPKKQKSNFSDIVAFKKMYPNKVILLWGNHDHHYHNSIKETYSNFQEWDKTSIKEMINKALNEGLFQMCYIKGNVIFVHAGITKTWLKSTGYTGEDPLDIFVNDVFKYKPDSFNFNVGKNGSPYGDDITQSPIWVRSRSLYVDKIPNYIQVVGHTIQDKIEGLNGSRKVYTDGKMVETSGVISIDTLGTSKEYLEIIDGKFKAKKI